MCYYTFIMCFIYYYIIEGCLVVYTIFICFYYCGYLHIDILCIYPQFVHNITRCIWQYYWWSALTSAIVPTKVYVFWYLPFYYKELAYTAQLLRCRNVGLLIRRWRCAPLVVVVVVWQVSESSQAPNTGRRKP